MCDRLKADFSLRDKPYTPEDWETIKSVGEHLIVSIYEDLVLEQHGLLKENATEAQMDEVRKRAKRMYDRLFN